MLIEPLIIAILEILGWLGVVVMLIAVFGATMLCVILFGESEDKPV